MEKAKLVAGIVVIAALLIFAFGYRRPVSNSDGTVEFIGLMVSERVTRYPMSGEVTGLENQTLGIAAEEQLNFGRVPSGTTVKKTIILYNDDPEPVKIRIAEEGNIAPFVKVSRNNFLLEGTGKIVVSFAASDQGNFTGSLNIAAVKPRNWLARWFLQWT